MEIIKSYLIKFSNENMQLRQKNEFLKEENKRLEQWIERLLINTNLDNQKMQQVYEHDNLINYLHNTINNFHSLLDK